jgi:hypothetical protein
VTTRDASDNFSLGALDMSSGQTLARLCSPPIGVANSFAIAAPRLFARVGTGLQVYDAGSAEPVGPLLGAGASIDWAGLSPDGDWLAWSSFIVPSVGAQVTLVNATTGEERPIGGPANTYFAVAPSSGGQLVAVEDMETRVVSVNDAASQATLAQIAGSLDGALLGFSADSSALIFGDQGNLQAIDWRTGAAVPSPLPSVQALPPAAQSFMQTSGAGCGVGFFPYATFSADGSRVAVGSSCSRPWELGVNPQTELYDVASGALLQSFPETEVPEVSSDGSVIAFGVALWCQ